VAGSNHFLFIGPDQDLGFRNINLEELSEREVRSVSIRKQCPTGKITQRPLLVLATGWDLLGVRVEVIWLTFGLVQDNGREQAGEKDIIKDKTV
jgi:hypothetical protein